MQSTDFLLGMILPYGGLDIAPSSGWLMCDGKEYDTTGLYANLYNKIGTRFGSSGAGKFNVPDMRGLFMRGRDGGIGRDTYSGSRTCLYPGACDGDNVGSYQQDQFISHCHHFNVNNNVQTTGGGTQWWNTNPGASTCPPYTTTAGSGHGSDSRPHNVGVNYIIKY